MQIRNQTNKEWVIVQKPVGATPLDCVRAYQVAHPELDGKTISYAGRLDPMAEGLLLLLIGEANKRRRTFEHWDKTYELVMLCGVSTDSGDLLGLPTPIETPVVLETEVQRVIASLVGSQTLPYPLYSAVKVAGKPLYWWARRGGPPQDLLPSKQVTIHSIELLSYKPIRITELDTYIRNTITKVRGDFRQSAILSAWSQVFAPYVGQKEASLPRIHLRVRCSSGTYMRSLCSRIGQELGIQACAYQIIRTEIGPYHQVTEASAD